MIKVDHYSGEPITVTLTVIRGKLSIQYSSYWKVDSNDGLDLDITQVDQLITELQEARKLLENNDATTL